MKKTVENIGVLIFQQCSKRLLFIWRSFCVIVVQIALQDEVKFLDAATG